MAEEKDKKEQAADSKKPASEKKEKKAVKEPSAKKAKAGSAAEDTKKAETKKPAAKKKTVKKDDSGKAPEKKKEEKKEAKKEPAKAKPEKAVEKKAGTKKADDKKKEDKKEKKPKAKSEKSDYVSRLKVKYHKEIIPALLKKFKYANVMEVPKMTKITLNIGMGDAIQNKNLLDIVVEDLAIVSGQKPVITKAKKSVSNFKLREGYAIGCRVTLRKEKMYEFLDRFISLAVPRIRDFRGVSDKSFDGFGNYNLGVKEQIIFPEIDYDKIEIIHGLDINFVTTAKTDEECFELLKLFGMPFVEREVEEEAPEAESA